MGLDVDLYEFKDLDTEAILKLSRFADELSTVRTTRHDLNSPSDAWSEYRASLAVKANELGLPDNLDDDTCDTCFGGVKVSSILGEEWDGFFSYTWGLLHNYLGRDVYYVFPEAEGDPTLVRPDWVKAKEKMMELLGQFRQLDPKSFEKFGDGAEEFANQIARMEVIIETLDYVLAQKNKNEFLLYWSA